MRTYKRTSLAGVAIAIAASVMGCMAEGRESDTGEGEVSMDLQIAPGVTVNTVTWTISHVDSGFTRTGSVNVRFSNTIAFQTGPLPPGAGYSIALSATSADGAFTCAGSATFTVTAFTVTPVNLVLSCSTAPPGQGSIIVGGTTQVCANLDSLSASPLQTAVNTPISLSATASVGSLTPTFAWTATAGTFDNPAIAAPTFTCPATPGPVTITVTVSPGTATCTTVRSQSVVAHCDALDPTFTNMYATIIGVRCVSCHRPGGGGVTVGMLDMSQPAAAYANLVGVPAQGIGAGTSGITCASVMPRLTRVTPNDAAGSLLFTKVHTKLVATPAPCGSPMPLPAAAAALTAAEVDLIGAWINGGALNN